LAWCWWGGTKINEHASLNGFNALFWVVGQLSNEQCNWLITRSQKQIIITFSIYFAFFHLSADLSKMRSMSQITFLSTDDSTIFGFCKLGFQGSVSCSDNDSLRNN
jgi:hypothetical protein